MFFSQPVSDVIKKRFSSRSYLGKPILAGLRQQMTDSLATLNTYFGR